MSGKVRRRWGEGARLAGSSMAGCPPMTVMNPRIANYVRKFAAVLLLALMICFWSHMREHWFLATAFVLQVVIAATFAEKVKK